MKATVWGCRGSVAVAGKSFMRYGGHTSCIEVRGAGGEVLVLDAGTGIRELGHRLADEGAREIHVFLSHLHLDHLQGLAFFKPMYDPDVELHLWGPPSPTRDLRSRIGAYMSEPLFPVNIGDVPCQAVFHDAPDDGVQIGGIDAWASPVAHQGPTVGYRFDEGSRSLVYVPDHEPALGGNVQRVDSAWLSGFGLASRADVLFHDAQYTEHEYPAHVGWGHSSIEHVVDFARVAQVKQLVLFHHDPGHADDQLEVIGARARELWGDAGSPPVLAYDGMSFEVGDSLAAVA